MYPKVLVVYYSRTGITKKLALAIAKELHADVEELVDTKKRKWLLWYLGAGKDAALKRQTKIQEVVYDPSAYDIVVLGTPVRDFTMATAIRAYITLYEKSFLNSLLFFCTQANGWAKETFQEMAILCGKKPIAEIVFSAKEILQEKYQERLNFFLSQQSLSI